jgi:hypothetical protein
VVFAQPALRYKRSIPGLPPGFVMLDGVRPLYASRFIPCSNLPVAQQSRCNQLATQADETSPSRFSTHAVTQTVSDAQHMQMPVVMGAPTREGDFQAEQLTTNLWRLDEPGWMPQAVPLALNEADNGDVETLSSAPAARSATLGQDAISQNEMKRTRLFR